MSVWPNEDTLEYLLEPDILALVTSISLVYFTIIASLIMANLFMNLFVNSDTFCSYTERHSGRDPPHLPQHHHRRIVQGLGQHQLADAEGGMC